MLRSPSDTLSRLAVRRHPLLVLVAALTVACGAYAQASALDIVGTLDGPVDATQPAVRGERVQLTPIPLPPVAAGCLKGSVARVSQAVDPDQRWWVGTITGNWKVTFHAELGPRGPVVVVGDSLTLGSENSLMRNLIDAGYGPICVDGGVARRMTVGATSAVSNAVNVIARIKASDPVWQLSVVTWVMGIGTNDARINNTGTYPTTVQDGIDAIGTSDHPIFWINVRTRQLWARGAEDLWNSYLLRPGVVVVDWAAAVDPSLSTYINGTDFIHLTTAGYAMRGQLVAQTLVAH